MKCVTHLEQGAPCALALGMFDGVHIGHQAVLEVSTTLGLIHTVRSEVLTFINHPMGVVGSSVPPQITLPAEKVLQMTRSCVDLVRMIPFTQEFAMLSAQEFLEMVVGKLCAKYIVVGDNYSFGAGGKGNIQLLAQMQELLQYELHVVPKSSICGLEISSTAIRQALIQGDVRKAGLLLGRAYSIGGLIAHGRALGRQMGFPTINVKSKPGKILPRFGVYAGFAQIEGKRHAAVINIGMRPTVGGENPLLEAHLVDFNENVYGKAARLHLVCFIREELKFADVQGLRTQIAQDLAATRRILQV